MNWKNWKKILEDADSGELDFSKWVIVQDNDCGYWSYVGPDIDDELCEKMCQKMNEKYGKPDGAKFDYWGLCAALNISTDAC